MAKDDFPPLPRQAHDQGPVIVRGFKPLSPRPAQGELNGTSAGVEQANTVPSHLDETRSETNAVQISADGDVLLHITDENSRATVLCRVSRNVLRKASPFFSALLDPSKFSEGISTEGATEALLRRYHTISAIPARQLHIVTLRGIGDMTQARGYDPTKVIISSLQLIHGSWTTATESVTANLVAMMGTAMYWGTFDLLCAALADSAKANTKTQVARWAKLKVVDEAHLRQKLLIAIRTGAGPKVIPSLTSRLVLSGDKLRPKDFDYEEWYSQIEVLDLPNGIEGMIYPFEAIKGSRVTYYTEELLYRRHCILRALASLQAFVLLYFRGNDNFGIRCRLGLENSYQCDIFHFGLAHRFFDRIKTLSLRSSLAPDVKLDKLDASKHDFDYYDGDIPDLTHQMKGAPTQQIDKFHSYVQSRVDLRPTPFRSRLPSMFFV